MTRIREVLAEIAAQPAACWERLLAERFRGDPLLAQQGLLWLHATGTRADRAPPSLGVAGDERYELALRLDSGATAAVWQAYDRKLGRNVAIKILHARDDTARFAQLILEARAACDVISDHVVRILDVNAEEPRPYIVMELVGEHDAERGELVLGTAASACAPTSIAEVARWVMQVARGVHDAHMRNVFHRDLKPANVLVTPLSRHARIADFGLAVSAANEGVGPTSSSLVTRGAIGAISVSGTPEYIAPEQARGLPVQLDPRIADDRAVLVAIDVWGLGALAYDLLGGRPPWTCVGDREPWEVAASGARPARLERTVRGERIPARLRRIVEQAMAPEPAARYETAARVANELEAFLARRPTSFDRSRHVRVGLWGRRNPQLALAAGVATALVLLVLVTRSTVTRLRGERDALDREVEVQETELRGLTRNVEQTRDELADTERILKQRGEDLTKLERSIQTYQAVLQQKEAALREATAATRELGDRLDATRAAAARQQVTYEHDLAAARADAEAAVRERDKIRAERDRARLNRDTFAAERDEARRALVKLQQDLAHLAEQPETGGDRTKGARH